MERIPEPSRRDLVVFGAVLPFFAVGVGLLLAHRTGVEAVAWVVGGAGLAVAAVFAAVPRSRRGIYRGWLRATYPIGFVVTLVVLSAVWWLVVTPIALLLRLLRIDPMARRRAPAGATYWIPREAVADPERSFRQY